MTPRAAVVLLAAVVVAGVITVDATTGCGGRQIKKLTVASDKDSILSVVNVTTRFVDDGPNCLLAVAGCVQITKSINTSIMSIKVKRGPVTIMKEDNMDACEMGKSIPVIGEFIMGPQGDCRHQPGIVCIPPDTPPLDITQYASMLDMAVGTWNAKITFTHDSGKSCMNAVVKIV